jgi:hypothetical protein
VGPVTRIGVLMALVALVVCALSGPAKGLEPVLAHPPAGLAFVTGTGTGPDQIAVASTSGAGARALGPGDSPLISPDGTLVAASLFSGGSESGPALAVYRVTSGPSATYLSLAKATVQPLAWSHDSRYLACFARSTSLTNTAPRSSLEVLDTNTGTIVTIAHGQISGASFSPDARDLLVFSKSRSELNTRVNLYTAQATGAGLRRITADGRSLNPVWGAKGIAYDRQRLRRQDAPVFQIWLRSASGSTKQLTHLRIPKLVSGLVPVAFSSDGTRLLAEFEGQDTSEAWTVTVASRRARRLRSHGRSVLGEGISSDGSAVLVGEGSFEEPPSNGRIATLPFGGGAPALLVAHGAAASWNR